jgi:DNA (cytosine-5)-methyltransferase 1
MSVSYEVSGTLRAQEHGHQPIVLIYDARGNGGGEICPTITGDHQNRVTDYTAVVVEVTDEENIRRDEVLPMGRV